MVLDCRHQQNDTLSFVPLNTHCAHIYIYLSNLLCCSFEILLQDGAFGTGTPKPSGWTHIVLNYLGPNNGQGIRIYHNGTEVASDTTKASHGFSAGDGRIAVGRYRTNRNDHYGNAQVDELIFFNQALSQDDITMLHYGA